MLVNTLSKHSPPPLPPPFRPPPPRPSFSQSCIPLIECIGEMVLRAYHEAAYGLESSLRSFIDEHIGSHFDPAVTSAMAAILTGLDEINKEVECRNSGPLMVWCGVV